MMRSPLTRIRACSLSFLVLCATHLLVADNRVAVVATAEGRYTDKKFGDGKPRRETYVVMQGLFYGGITVDRILERMTIRQVVSYLVPKLAEQEYVPAKSLKEADLLLAIHWGVTNPRVGRLEMTAETSVFTPTAPVTIDPNDTPEVQEKTEALNNLFGSHDRYENFERIGDYVTEEKSQKDLAQLLGYSDVLTRLNSKMVTTTEEQTLRSDLARERYFIIVRAYELRNPENAGKPRRPVWTIHLNVSSPGNNFRTALTRMSHVAPDFIGRTTDDVESVRAKAPSGIVDLGELIIVGTTP